MRQSTKAAEMLPATGLFRSINCPFFEKDLCTRPFCHFRHLKPEAPAKATYSATPKSLLNQNNAPEAAHQDGPVKKKPKLEYIPMPTILAAKYVPSTKPSTVTSNNHNKVEEPPIECKPELESGDHQKTEDALEDKVEQAKEAKAEKLTNGQNGKEQKHEDDEPVSLPVTKKDEPKPKELEEPVSEVVPEAKERKQKDSEKSSSSHSIHRKSSQESDKHRKSSRDEKDHRKEKSHRSKESERKASSSSTSERKHSSSSSSHRDDKHRSRSDREKEREKDRSKSKHNESSRDKEKRSGKEKERTKSSDKDREKDRKKSSDKDRSKSSHSSSKSSSKSSSRDNKSSSSTSKSKPSETATSSSSSTSKPKGELADEIYRDLLDNPPSDIDIESDEDEVMRQCRMIFEEYEDDPPPAPAPVPKPVKKKPDPQNSGSDVELIDMFAEKFYDENKKKRVAHESGSSAARPASSQPPPAKRTNHVQDAMRSVYHRQEIVRKQQEELAAKQRIEEENKKRIEDETRKAMSKPVTPRLSNGSPRSPVLSPTPVTTPPTTDKSPVSPISTSSFYSKSPDSLLTTTPRGRFTPAVNVLAFQKAKEKIEQLRKMKSIGTPAQTAPKRGGRVAHVPVVPPPTASTSTAPAPTATPAPPPPPAKAAPPVLEAESTKISYNIRMQFYNLMIKHCLNIYTSCDDAYDRAQTEELAVMKKCSTPMIYKSSALLTINKLRKEAVESGSETTDRGKTISHDVILAGKMGHNISWSVNKKLKTEVKSVYTIDNAPSTVAYKMIYECILTEAELQANGFPRATDTPGKAKIHTPKPSRPPNEDERYCSRCSVVYNLETYEEPAVDTCNYHSKRTCYRRGFADNLHSCCQQPAGTAGCMYANYHVSSYIDYDDLTGFVKTIEPPEGYVPTKKDIFALDCEMCYTTSGLELTRITVVDINEKTVYDSLVKPTNRVIDYNTRFSGITEQMLKNTTTTLYNVQAVLLSMFNSETILVGHSLESDFKALKLIHDVVVDTSVLYPHKMGPPKKRALKTLCIENLKKIIQENDNGHDSAEDSVVCIQLIKHYLRNRII